MTIKSMTAAHGHDVSHMPDRVIFKPEAVAARITDRQQDLEDRVAPYFPVVDVSHLPAGPDRLCALALELEAVAQAARELAMTVDWDNMR